MRWGLSPVFIYECLANSRRWQTYAIRSIGVAILLAAIATIALSHASRVPTNRWREYAALGESYFYAIIGVELTLVMLAAPAATAGAICVDRARGTLTHMLVTELSDAEIVLGKLAARLLPVLGLVACTWPVLSICSLLGGIDPKALSLAFAIILAVALLGCTMALALSVWARKPHEVVLVTYTFWIFVLLLWPIWLALSRGGLVGPPPPWTLVANPHYLAFAPYTVPGRMDFWDYFGFFAATLGAYGVLIVLAVRRMRPVACRGNAEDRIGPRFGLLARVTRWLPGPSLDRDPVLWREWHRSRPSRWLLALVVLIGGSTMIACVVGAVSIWANGLDQGNQPMGPIIGICGYMLQLGFGFLMLSAVAPMSMSEERQRGSLDLLATTTLSTSSIVIGKWLGTLRLVPLLAIGPGLVGFALASVRKTTPSIAPRPGMLPEYFELLSRAEALFAVILLVATIFIHGALIASIGLALATWVSRQSRAIAISVATAVMVSVGWPIFLSVIRVGIHGQGMTCLSPIMATGNLTEIMSTRLVSFRDTLWWALFWDIECLVVALGLLWLTVRTFDACFGRIPERPRRTTVLTDIVVVLAALVGVGDLFGAIAIETKSYWGYHFVEDFAVMATTLLVTVGLILVAALASSSISRGRTPGVAVLEPESVTIDRKQFAGLWWQSFRLVLLLAIGPALIALTLATAGRPVEVSKSTDLPGGGTQQIHTYPSGRTYVYTMSQTGGVPQFRYATDAEIAAAMPARPPLRLARLLSIAVLTVITMLAHGAAFASLGLALGIGIRARIRAIAATVCLLLFVTVAWPILCLIWGGPGHGPGMAMASHFGALSVILVNMHHEKMLSENVWWVSAWDVFFALLSIVVAMLAIWTLDRRSRLASPTENKEQSRPPRSAHTASSDSLEPSSIAVRG
jgi:ABC-type transport system involved in multi-copper enzyme maturation permease subunit